jgi:hypothetical protein
MKYSIRNLIGVILLISLALIILRRPIAIVLNDAATRESPVANIFQSVCMPYYVDFYLLGFDDYWPFEQTFDELLGKKPTLFGFSCLLITIASSIVSVLLHLFGCVWAVEKINERFFK